MTNSVLMTDDLLSSFICLEKKCGKKEKKKKKGSKAKISSIPFLLHKIWRWKKIATSYFQPLLRLIFFLHKIWRWNKNCYFASPPFGLLDLHSPCPASCWNSQHLRFLTFDCVCFILEITTACADQIKQHKSFRLIFTGMKDICLGNLKVVV